MCTFLKSKIHCRESLNREETGDVPDIAATKAYIHTYINTYNLPMLRTTMTLTFVPGHRTKRAGQKQLQSNFMSACDDILPAGLSQYQCNASCHTRLQQLNFSQTVIY